MSRKLFISFLGFSNYGRCHYAKDNYTSGEIRFVQEATIEYLNSVTPWTSDDAALILLTKGAEEKNWVDDGQKDREGNPIRQQGLRSRLELMNLPLQVVPVTGIPDGNNEKEIMEIFSTVFTYLKDGDEIYIDVTHGFRSLPMLMLVFGNYAKFLKHAVVKSITYGNFEGRDKVANVAQLVDLLPLSSIQDWTFAAANFLENGNVNQLAKLSETQYRAVLKETKGKDENAKNLRVFTDALKSMVADFQACRGLNIVRSTNIAPLKSSLEMMQSTAIEPLNPVIARINEATDVFSATENVSNGFKAARWCLQNGLYQQSATILQENVVTYFALRHGIGMDDEGKRGVVNSAFTILFNKLPEDKWSVREENIQMLKDMLTDDLLNDNDTVCAFNNLSEVRNDLNHSGMRSKRKPLSAKSIRENIEKSVTFFESKLYAD